MTLASLFSLLGLASLGATFLADTYLYDRTHACSGITENHSLSISLFNKKKIDDFRASHPLISITPCGRVQHNMLQGKLETQCLLLFFFFKKRSFNKLH